jgi:hypothetical protein
MIFFCQAACGANWANGQGPGIIWSLRIMFASSIPSSVAAADTHIVVDSAARHANEPGPHVTVLSDCCAVRHHSDFAFSLVSKSLEGE